MDLTQSTSHTYECKQLHALAFQLDLWLQHVVICSCHDMHVQVNYTCIHRRFAFKEKNQNHFLNFEKSCAWIWTRTWNMKQNEMQNVNNSNCWKKCGPGNRRVQYRALIKTIFVFAFPKCTSASLGDWKHIKTSQLNVLLRTPSSRKECGIWNFVASATHKQIHRRTQ